MRSPARLFTAMMVIGGAVVLGAVLGWWSSRPDARAARQGPALQESATTNPPARSASRRPMLPRGREAGLPPTHAAGRPAAANATNLITNWAEAIEEVLRLDLETDEIGRRLVALLPRLPEPGQVAALGHIANLLEDADYAPLTKLLADPKTPEHVLDALMVDVLNRANSLKLPALLEVARAEGHPRAAEAKDVLELYLEEDLGTDWAAWAAKLRAWLQENPD
jgi:hypothetical protein